MTQPTQLSNQGTIFTGLSTEMNSQANAASVTSSAGGASGVFSNTQTGYYLNADMQLFLNTMTAPTAYNLVSGWFLETIDGTNYETAAAAVNRNPDFSFTMAAITTGYYVCKGVFLPIANFKIYLTNNSGQAFASSGNVLKILPYTSVYPTQ